jgi:Glucodextranase, domain B
LRLWLLFCLVLFLAACGQNQAVLTPEILEQNTPDATGVSMPTDVAGPASSAPTVTLTVSDLTPGVVNYSSGDFSLMIYSPADGDVVNQPQVELRGQTTVETVLSVNNEIHILPAQQDFVIPVPLEEGPNVIEIVASDYAGNEIDIILTVTYQSEE